MNHEAPATPATTTGDTATIDAKELARLRAIDETSHRIKEHQAKVTQLHDDWKRKADGALAAKKSYDEQQGLLIDMIKQLDDPQQRLPFELTAGSTATTQPPAQDAAAEPITMGWEMVPVSALGLTAGTTAKLVEYCKTLGQLENRRKEHGRALDIPGIGEKTADKINEAADEWLRQNRDKAVFDSAAAAPAEAAAAAASNVDGQKFYRLLVDIALGAVTMPKGSIYPFGEIMDGGRIFLVTSDDDGFSVEPGEVQAVGACSKMPVEVEITAPVPGCDADDLPVGFKAQVTQWHGQNVVVKTVSAREVLITTAEFKPTTMAWVEAQA